MGINCRTHCLEAFDATWGAGESSRGTPGSPITDRQPWGMGDFGKDGRAHLTAELLAWLYGVTRRTHYVIAPSQREEAKLGFDAGFYGAGPGLLIQFKKAHVAGTLWSWQLNRTKLRDQHERLQRLDFSGIPVFYAFPHFQRPRQVVSWRRRLLTHTFWIRPGVLSPPGGPTGHHDLMYEESTGAWALSSPDPIQIEPVTALRQIAAVFEHSWPEGRMNEVPMIANSVLFGSAESGGSQKALRESESPLDDLAQGLALVGTTTGDEEPAA